MILQNPLGLLGLLAIPVLILIYIIKSKYTEQVIPSTYLWTLSERFLKRKNPIKTITGLISLILQILAVVFISLALAHPVFTLAGRADDYCFVIDGSGSMNVVEDGVSRFEQGKEEVRKIISSSADGSTYTIIVTGNIVDTPVKTSSDKNFALNQLQKLSPSHMSRNVSSATTVAQSVFDELEGAGRYYVVTDKYINSVENAEVIRVGNETSNFAIDGVSYEFDGGNVEISGKVLSYGGDGKVTVAAFADGGATPVASGEVSLTRAQGAIDAISDFSIIWQGTDGIAPAFRSLTVQIDANDGLSLDNSVILYNAGGDEAKKTLIVSDTPSFLEFAFTAASNIQTDVMATDDYTEDVSGYGLYVFDKYSPARLPSDGAVWFVNPQSSVADSGFTVKGRADDLTDMIPVEKNPSTALRVKRLTNGMSDDNVQAIPQVVEYVKCGIINAADFITVMSCKNDPVVFAGENNLGNREAVIALDSNTSDFFVSHNGATAIRNLIEFTFPTLVNSGASTTPYCGETIALNMLTGYDTIRVDMPSGKFQVLTSSTDFELTEMGEYTITAVSKNSRQVEKVFCQLPVAERVSSATEASFVISGQPSEQKRDGVYGDLLYAFIILAVIVVADWLVYCYEQYQLR